MNSQLLRKLVQRIDATKLDLHLFSLRFCLYFSCQTLDKHSKPWTGTWRSTGHKVTRVVWMTWDFQAAVPSFANPNPHWRVSSYNWIELIFNTWRWVCGCLGETTRGDMRQGFEKRVWNAIPRTPNYATRSYLTSWNAIAPYAKLRHALLEGPV